MAHDDDLTEIIPDPPPPDGDRRSEAIQAALRRFDARGGKNDQKQRPRPAAEPARRQLAVLASAALVLLVTVPILLTRGDNLGRVDSPSTGLQHTGLPADQPDAPSPLPGTGPTPLADLDAVTEATASADTADSIQTVSGDTGPAEGADSQRSALAGRAPVALSDSSAAAGAAERRAGGPAAATRPSAMVLAAPPPPPPPPPAQETELADAETAASNVVVTGARISSTRDDRAASRARSRPTSRQLSRWRACTLVDPDKNVTRCSDRVSPGAADIARGLDLAFRGEDTAALRAFDAAIARAPQAIGGYINRGLVYRRIGEREAALGDLDAAIRVAPSDARGYYFRSLLLREGGDGESADRDLQTAMRLDLP